MIPGTADVFFGLEDPSPEAWQAWHARMLAARAATLAEAGLDPDPYAATGDTDWSDASFRQFFLFMYDAAFYDRNAQRYRTAELLGDWRARFGRVDSVLLWHAYPRLGFDARTQFDFYREMPGGLDRLRRDVSDVFHAHGVRVFVDYNPWDAGSYDELAEIVAALDADGVMLDTMTEAPERLAEAVLRRRPGVVFAPELRPRDADLGGLRQSWAQWIELGAERPPSLHRLRWLVPRHRQFVIRRWDPVRRADIVDSFFNGAGLLLWDNVFGSWNPYGADDRRLIAETAAVLDRYGDLVAHGRWEPLVPTGARGLDANRWTDRAGRSLLVLRNRRAEPVRFRARDDLGGTPLWGPETDDLVIEAGGVQALAVDPAGAVAEVREHLRRLGDRAASPRPGYDERRPRPRRLSPGPAVAATQKRRGGEGGWVRFAGGAFTMRIVHERRECGCVPDGADETILDGWFYKDVVGHTIAVDVAPFAIRMRPVTNAEFLAFVHASGYAPRDPARFLAHLRASGAELPPRLSPELADRPVTHVSLEDARAYASFHGESLPTEAEWQFAAEKEGGALEVSGGPWELTESEHFDGHTGFVFLRGGSPLPLEEKTSEWLVPRGPQPSDFHAKYLLLGDGLDRAATVSFRTVLHEQSRGEMGRR